MATRLVSIDLLTASYRIVGKLEVAGGGVQGVVCDPTSSFMDIREVSLARIHMATQLAEQADLVRVVKSQVIAVCLARREDVGPQATVRGGYARVYRYPLRLTTDIFEVDGTLEWPGRFDFTAIMAEGTSEFFPLFDASLGAILFPALLIQCPALVFNRSFLNTLVLLNESG